jgi:hypothetical protein
MFSFARGASAAAFIALFAGAAVAQGQPAPAGSPAFKPDRTAEDYGYLRDPAKRGDWSDGYKFVPLNDSGSAYISFGGEVRERVELYDAPRFGLAGGSKDGYLLHRALLHADLHLGEAVRVFAQFDEEEAVSKKLINMPDQDDLDVQQLFLELRPFKTGALRVGRQEMIFNPARRFVSFRDAANVRQNHDGARLTINAGDVRAEAFAVAPVIIKPGTFDNRRDPNQLFAGSYLSKKLDPKGSLTLDGYYFLLQTDNIFVGPRTGRENRHMVGIRFAGSEGRFEWDAEGAYQFGDRVSQNVGAYALSADLGYSFPASRLKPRIGVRFDMGSGDDSPTDRKAGSFNPLFPDVPYFDEGLLTSWTNMVAVRPNVRIQPTKKLTVAGAAMFKWRQDVDDFVYRGLSVALPGTRNNRAREIGQMYVLDTRYQLNRNFLLQLHYVHHTAGDAIRLAGGKDVDFLMSSVRFQF